MASLISVSALSRTPGSKGGAEPRTRLSVKFHVKISKKTEKLDLRSKVTGSAQDWPSAPRAAEFRRSRS